MNFRAFQRIWAAALGLAPDAIFAIGGAPTGALQQHTQTIPIVFSGPDPVDAGLVGNIARPERNITGFSFYWSSIAGKWIEFTERGGTAPDQGRDPLQPGNGAHRLEVSHLDRGGGNGLGRTGTAIR